MRFTSLPGGNRPGAKAARFAVVGAPNPCKFKPATNNGVPEAGWAQLAFAWTLD